MALTSILHNTSLTITREAIKVQCFAHHSGTTCPCVALRLCLILISSSSSINQNRYGLCVFTLLWHLPWFHFLLCRLLSSEAQQAVCLSTNRHPWHHLWSPVGHCPDMLLCGQPRAVYGCLFPYYLNRYSRSPSSIYQHENRKRESIVSSERTRPTNFFLLPSSFFLLPSSFFLLPSSFFLLPSSFFLLPSSFFLLCAS